MRCSMRASGRRWYSAPPRWPCTSRHCEHPPQRRPEDAVLRGVDGVVVVADLERDHQDGSARRLIADANPSADGPGGLVDRAITLHHAVQQGALAEPGERLGERGPQIGVRLGFDVVVAHTEESGSAAYPSMNRSRISPTAFGATWTWRSSTRTARLDCGPGATIGHRPRGGPRRFLCQRVRSRPPGQVECGRLSTQPGTQHGPSGRFDLRVAALHPRHRVDHLCRSLHRRSRSSAPVNKHRPPVDRRRWRPASSTNSCGSGCSASRTP